MNPIDQHIKTGLKWLAVGGWLLSIFFSANGFGLKAGTFFIIAGYFLAVMVTMFEVALGRYGTQLPKTLAWICVLAYAFGIVTNQVGIWVGRGSGTGPIDIGIAVVLGIVLEIFPEPLFMFAAGHKSPDLLNTLGSLIGRRRQNANPPRQQYSQEAIPSWAGAQGSGQASPNKMGRAARYAQSQQRHNGP